MNTQNLTSEQKAAKIIHVLHSCNLRVKNIDIVTGPTTTLFKVEPQEGVRIAKIKSLENEIALALKAKSIRVMAPMLGEGVVGIEIANDTTTIIPFEEVIDFNSENINMELPISLGKDINNKVQVIDLTKAPHLLVAGATGQGKSVALNVIISSLLSKRDATEVKLVLIDPKRVEFALYSNLEKSHLAAEVITDNQKAADVLRSLCLEMDNRYELLKNSQVRNIKEYNSKGGSKLPYIVTVIDEFADLIMTVGKEVEGLIVRLAQLSRAVGIHLIVATQRPSVNIITGLIKANFPARIAFKTTTALDSRIILDQNGAEQLLGNGDMLLSMNGVVTRIQGAYISTEEVEQLVNEVAANNEELEFTLPEKNELEEAKKIVIKMQKASISLLEKFMNISYRKAAELIDDLEDAGVISTFNGNNDRNVLVK